MIANFRRRSLAVVLALLIGASFVFVGGPAHLVTAATTSTAPAHSLMACGGENVPPCQ